MRLAIMGAGSLGIILGAYVKKGGLDIDYIDVNEENVKVLNEKGATVTGTVDFNVPANALTPDKMEGIYDVVFYVVKQTYNDVALNQLLPHLGPNSAVVTLQNGVPEPAIAEIVGAERVIGCPVGWGATWLGPGLSELTSNPEKMTFDLGEYKGGVTERLGKIKEILELMCPTLIEENLMGIRWTKVLVNSTFSGMSAALGCTFGDVLDSKEALDCVKHIANECIQVAIAADIKMEPMQGYDIGSMLSFTTKEEMDSKDSIYNGMWGPHRKLKASMLQDLEKGLRTEIDAINGIVCDFGKKHGIPTPVNSQVVEIVKSIESGKNRPVFDNLKLFKLPEVK
ncbi:MAG: ketopantoate reductase family protein [Tissierellales bacterium]